MKHNLVCQEDLDQKIWGCGIGDHYQKKRGMFFETSYLLLSVNKDYYLKGLIWSELPYAMFQKERNQLKVKES